ncbi:MAG: HD domain-containing protein [Sulfurimonas sp.]|nr:HD domain-containing protein [Sulfurimonas sp.]MDD3059696.1 HD domain-containing protein [Sulfurimonas sp.]MDD5201910.1 HD domain-containing protein [Sulfurimonas sp.]
MSIFEQSRDYLNNVLPEQISSIFELINQFLGQYWWIFVIVAFIMFLVAMRYFRKSIQQRVEAQAIDESLKKLSTKKDIKSVGEVLLKSAEIIKSHYIALYELRGETYVLIESNIAENKDASISLRVAKREIANITESGKYIIDVFIGNNNNYMILFYSKQKLDRQKFAGYLDVMLSYYGAISDIFKAKGADALLSMSKSTSVSLMKLQMDNKQFLNFFVALIMKISDAKGAKLLTKLDEPMYVYLNNFDYPLQKTFYIRNTPYKLEFYDNKELDREKMIQIGSFLDTAGSFLVNMDSKSEMVRNYLELLKFTNEGMELGNEYYRDHSLMVQTISVEIAKSLYLSESEIDAISMGAYLHDIGMIGDVFSVLEKDNIEESDMNLIKEHPLIGSVIVEPISHVYPITEIIKYHHERYDGKGYPFGLKDAEIPLNSQIVALGEFYTGIIGDRPYRKGKTHEEALVEVDKMRDKMFASVVVDAFLDVEKSLNNKINKIRFKWNKND